MTIDASHRPWIVATVVLAGLSAVGYVVYAAKAPGGPSGGSLPGLLYGTSGSALMLYAGLLSARKQVPTWRIGRAQTWVRGHIWLGLLSVPLILFHSGFRWGGLLEQVLWALLILIVGSGVFGLVLQQFMPRLMTRLVPLETIYEQIDHVCQVMRSHADAAVTSVCGPLEVDASPEPPKELGSARSGGGTQGAALPSHSPSRPGAAGRDAAGEAGRRKPKVVEPQEGSGPLKEFYLREVRPFLNPGKVQNSLLASAARATGSFEQIRIMVPAPLHETLDQLSAFCGERRQLMLQARLHHLLHGWLFVHVPLSLALLVLGIAHAVVSLWY